MDKKKSKRDKCSSSFWRRNGVYLALVISILAVGAVIIAGFTQQLSKPEEKNPQNAQQPVEQKVTGQADTRTTTTSTTVSITGTTNNTTESAQLYLFPLSNTVQKPFSVDAPQFCVTMQDWRLHYGVDFAGEEGQVVKATARGTILSVKNDPLWGGVIEVDHGLGVISRYCGVKPIVKVGDEVECGDSIGDLQTIPCECAQTSHLHLEMLVDGVPIDPVSAIGLDVRYADTLE